MDGYPAQIMSFSARGNKTMKIDFSTKIQVCVSCFYRNVIVRHPKIKIRKKILSFETFVTKSLLSNLAVRVHFPLV